MKRILEQNGFFNGDWDSTGLKINVYIYMPRDFEYAFANFFLVSSSSILFHQTSFELSFAVDFDGIAFDKWENINLNYFTDVEDYFIFSQLRKILTRNVTYVILVHDRFCISQKKRNRLNQMKIFDFNGLGNKFDNGIQSSVRYKGEKKTE